ncbi:DHHA1 domain protein [compost metagenome]
MNIRAQGDGARAVVIYHNKCPDGFAAAFAAWLRLGEQAQYLAYDYGMEPPPVAGKDVYIVDFSFDAEVMQQLEQAARTVVLLDHHETAVLALRNYGCQCQEPGRTFSVNGMRCKPGNLFHLDMNKSGARLAWEYFHGESEVPELVRYVEDRDLWRWQYGDAARHYLAKLDSLPRDFALWRAVLEQSPEQRAEFVKAGEAMCERFNALVASIAREARPLRLFGHKGLMVNTTREFASEVCELLVKETGTFAAAWHHDAGGLLKVSLRGAPGFEVRSLAERLGGGGHPFAAAARLPASRIGELLTGSLG